MVTHQAGAGPLELRLAALNARMDRLPGFGLSRVVFPVLGATYFLTFYDITAISVSMPSLEKVFGVSETALAAAVTSNLFAYIVGAYLLSLAADYIGRRRALSIAIAIISIGAILTACSWDVISLAVFRGFIGLGMGAVVSLAATIMTEIAPPTIRGRGVALNVFWGGVGLATAPWIGLGIITWAPVNVGWRVVFGLGALAAVLLIFLNDRWVPESPRWLMAHGHEQRAEALVERMEDALRAKNIELPEPEPVSVEAITKRFPVGDLLRPPYLGRLVVVLVFWFFYYMACYAYLTYLPTLLEAMGIKESMLYSAVGDVSFVLGGFLTLVLIERWNRKYTAAGALVVGMIGLAILATGAGPVAVIIGTLITGLWISATAFSYSYSSEVFPTRARATGMSVGDGLGHLGGAVQPYVIVTVLAVLGPRPTFGLIIAMMAISAVVMLAAGVKTAGTRLADIAR